MTNPTASGDPTLDDENLKAVLSVPGMHLVNLGTETQQQRHVYHQSAPFIYLWPPEDPKALVEAMRAAADEVERRLAGANPSPED